MLGIAHFAVGADDSIPQAAIYQTLSLGSIGAIITGLIRHKPQRRIPWLLFGAGLVLWTLGDAYWDAYSWVLRTRPRFRQSRMLPTSAATRS